MIDTLKNLNASGRVLIVVPEYCENVEKSGRNIPGVVIEEASRVNVYGILNCSKLIISKKAIEKVQEVLV
ncbi:MAG: 50S ribosomal protein L4, partial [bacterium]|nr:50S ribosomal protein L4 [bacterium]